jgi:hypothetical protein
MRPRGKIANLDQRTIPLGSASVNLPVAPASGTLVNHAAVVA